MCQYTLSEGRQCLTFVSHRRTFYTATVSLEKHEWYHDSNLYGRCDSTSSIGLKYQYDDLCTSGRDNYIPKAVCCTVASPSTGTPAPERNGI